MNASQRHTSCIVVCVSSTHQLYCCCTCYVVKVVNVIIDTNTCTRIDMETCWTNSNISCIHLRHTLPFSNIPSTQQLVAQRTYQLHLPAHEHQVAKTHVIRAPSILNTPTYQQTLVIVTKGTFWAPLANMMTTHALFGGSVSVRRKPGGQLQTNFIIAKIK